MLQLQHIYKTYVTGDLSQRALEDITLGFRKNEFVAVSGVSGSGKTTLLNLIGGLDQYDKGDLIINGVSTKQYKDRDWDAYRNHSVGFVFQSYNLIPHQTVLANVELALTLSGVSKAERRKRASEMLEKVGLGDQLHKKPNQMSGGQMQRVAIARALINNPDILLADEPTGALDTETSLQIMALLSEIAADRLVIMVTHNPDLANTYASRIIQLRDGKVIGDTDPYDASGEGVAPQGPQARTSMSFWTAVSLSLNNLMTKKTRTILTAFAGSIGIIGIALILALQSGVQSYINRVEQDTLSTYPLTIESQTMDMSGLQSLMGNAMREEEAHTMDAVYENRMMSDMFSLMTTQMANNDLAAFKASIDSGENDIASLSSAIQYGYDLNLQIYKGDTSEGVMQVNPSTIFDNMGMGSLMNMTTSMGSSQMMTGMGSSMMGLNVWTEMLDNDGLLRSQYDVVTGRWPEAYNEVVLVVDEDNEISELTLYSLGLKDPADLPEMMARAMMGTPVQLQDEPARFTYDELMDLSYKLILSPEYYQEEDGRWVDMRGDEAYMKALLEDAIDLKIVGIIRPNVDAVSASISGTVAYTPALTEYVIDKTNEASIVKAQLENPQTDVFTGLAFDGSDADAAPKTPSLDDIDLSLLTEEQQAQLAMFSPEQIEALMAQYMPAPEPVAVTTTYAENLALLGIVDIDSPSTINIYPADFAAKEGITNAIDAYNRARVDAGEENLVITYTDIMGLLLSSVTTIVDVISYVLIAFVAISLVVSSIMIGIITYISVLERTKEIGILRSIGASKRDISRVFNAETLIVGLISGSLGVAVTLLLSIPINALIYSLAGIAGVAALPLNGAVILVVLSVLLTVIAGLIPSRLAAKKDPVAALRSE